MTTASHIADRMLRLGTQRPWGVAAAAVTDGRTGFAFEDGDSPIAHDTLFEWGSVTKTLTAVLLAEAVVRGHTTLETTVGELVDSAGDVADATLLELATHTSGFPREVPWEVPDPATPFDHLTGEVLVGALAAVERRDRGTPAYSNYGFFLLGHLLERVTGASYGDLLESWITGPLGMSRTTVATPDDGLRADKHAPGGAVVPWYAMQQPGAGGVGGTIGDLALWARAALDPGATPLEQALTMATSFHVESQSIGLGWMHVGGGWWHGGATDGMLACVAVYRPKGTAVAVLANSRDISSFDGRALAVLTDIARDQTDRWVDAR